MKVITLHKDQERLLKDARANNRDAQRKLYEHYAPIMLSVCRQYICDIHHAEDVMVMAFTKVFKHLDSFRHEGSFEGWIRRIMVREAISFLRTQKRIAFYTDEIPENGETVIMADTDLGVNEIQQLIDDLPEGYRIVFLMYAVEGYKHHEIAKALQITESTSRSQLFKARKILQQQLQALNKVSHGTR